MADEVAAPTTTAELASLDGSVMPSNEATIPATDEGLLRGDGVFEVIRVYDGRPFALRDHLDRIERSAANLRLDDVPRSELESEIPELLEERGGAAFDGYGARGSGRVGPGRGAGRCLGGSRREQQGQHQVM